MNIPSSAPGLPRAAWVVAIAITIDETAGDASLEYPLQYRAYFSEQPRDTDMLQQMLRNQQYLGDVLAYPSNETPGMRLFLDVNVAEPRRNKEAIGKIKEALRPRCPYTAMVVLSTAQTSGPGRVGTSNSRPNTIARRGR